MAWLREQVEPGHVAQFIICVDDWEIGSVYLRDIDRRKNRRVRRIYR